MRPVLCGKWGSRTLSRSVSSAVRTVGVLMGRVAVPPLNSVRGDIGSLVLGVSSIRRLILAIWRLLIVLAVARSLQVVVIGACSCGLWRCCSIWVPSCRACTPGCLCRRRRAIIDFPSCLSCVLGVSFGLDFFFTLFVGRLWFPNRFLVSGGCCSVYVSKLLV